MRPHPLILLVCCLALAVVACDDDSIVRLPAPAGEECPDVRPYTSGDGCDLTHFLRSAGVLNTAGSATGVAAANGFAYVADGNNGVVVVDACDPARMTVASRLPLSGEALDVAVVGDYLFVAAAGAGLAVVNVSDRTAPRVVGTSPGAGTPRDLFVDVRRNRVYVADDAVGLIIYDVRFPRRPKVIGVENTPGEARGVCVESEAGIAYVADALLGLRIVSVEDPGNPWLVKSVPTPGDATDVAVRGDYAFVADGVGGLTVIDVRSPVDASVVGRVDTSNRATDVAVLDDVAFVVDRKDGLILFDVTAPATPEEIARSEGAGFATALALARDYAYIGAATDGLRVVDVRTPAPAPVLSEFSNAFGRALALVTNGPFVYATNEQRVEILEWRDGALEARGYGVVGGAGVNATLYEGYLYVCAGPLGVSVFDTAATPDSLDALSVIPATSGAVDVAFADSVAFTVRSGLSSPTAFDLRTETIYPLTDIRGAVTRAVDVGTYYAYFVAVQGRMWVVQRDPAAVTPVVWVQGTNGSSTDVHVRGDVISGEMLFVANQAGSVDPDTGREFGAGVEVYDLVDPRAPAFRHLIETSIPAQRIGFRGDVMYVAGGEAGLEVFDVADPMSPIPIGSYWSEYAVKYAAFVDGAILLANDGGGVIALPDGCDRR